MLLRIQRLHTHYPFINLAVRGCGCAGEASSNTFTSANGIYLRGFKGDKPWVQWAGAAGDNATMPALLREAQPYLRLILMLRNPTTRWGCGDVAEESVPTIVLAAECSELARPVV